MQRQTEVAPQIRTGVVACKAQEEITHVCKKFYSSAFKAKVAMSALAGGRNVAPVHAA